MTTSNADDGDLPPQEATSGLHQDRRRAPRSEDASIPSTDRHILAYDRIKGLARRTFNKHVLSEIGGFAGLFALDAERFPDPVLVASTMASAASCSSPRSSGCMLRSPQTS